MWFTSGFVCGVVFMLVFNWIAVWAQWGMRRYPGYGPQMVKKQWIKLCVNAICRDCGEESRTAAEVDAGLVYDDGMLEDPIEAAALIMEGWNFAALDHP